LNKNSFSSRKGESVSPANKGLIWRLVAWGWRYRAGCIKVLLFQIALLALSLSGLGLTGLGIDYIRSKIDPQVPPVKWPFHWVPPLHWSPYKTLFVISFAILVLAIIKGLLNYASSLSSAHLIQMQIIPSLRTEVYNKLQRLSFRFFDENASGSIINRATGDVQNVRMFVEGVMIQSVTMVISLIVYFLFMLNLHVRLTFACLAATPLLWFSVFIFLKRVRPAYRRNRRLVDRMINTYAENIQGIQVIKGFAQEENQIRKFAVANSMVKNQQHSIFWRVSVFSPTIATLTQVNMTILLSYGGYLVFKNEMSLGAGLIVFVGLLQQFSSQVNNMAQITNSIQQSLIGARRVFEILDAPEEIGSPAKPINNQIIKGKIKFDHVDFGFTENGVVLKDVDFEIKAGQCVAILGATGSGKSTLMSLIPRFYDPSQGKILLDDTDLREFDVNFLRRQIGIVFQENFLFSTTIGANISFGKPKATVAEIEKAARMAAAHDFISQLPLGYDTVLGEGGFNLSGGQRQRLAIARALLLDPPILLLDDPTAAIDSRTEKEIFEAIENAIQNRTTFIVAHRLSTLSRADLILVLRDGAIVQKGTHEELMKLQGPYRGVAMLQLVDQESLKLMNSTPEDKEI
jgi:ATP-binding cassette subfamily B protein